MRASLKWRVPFPDSFIITVLFIHCVARFWRWGFGEWAATVATYLPTRPGELPKSSSSKPCDSVDEMRCMQRDSTGWHISLRTWVLLTLILAGQDGGTSQIKVNPTEVCQEMCHPVVTKLTRVALQTSPPSSRQICAAAEATTWRQLYKNTSSRKTDSQ